MLSRTILSAFLLASAVSARPVPQGAGIGQGCDYIFSDTDTTLGDLTESEGSAIAKKLGGGMRKRQGAGIGAGCDSIVSDADTTLGDLAQSEGAQIAKDLQGESSGQGNNGGAGGNPPPPPPGGPHKRQANGIGYGVADIIGALPGGSAVANVEGSTVNTIDGDSTNGFAELGQSIGNGELAAGKAIEQATGAPDSYSNGGAHSSVKRQANGIGYGIADVIGALPGGQDLADVEGTTVNDIDGDTTQGSAELGQSVGDFELATGKALEQMTGTPDSYSNGGAHSST